MSPWNNSTLFRNQDFIFYTGNVPFYCLQSESECSADQDENEYVTESEESTTSEDDLDVIREDSMCIQIVHHCLDLVLGGGGWQYLCIIQRSHTIPRPVIFSAGDLKLEILASSG